jgi:hypothetical protein
MASDYLLYRLIVSVRGSAEIADNASLVDEIAEGLYDAVNEATISVSDDYNVTIILDEE